MMKRINIFAQEQEYRFICNAYFCESSWKQI